MVVDVWRDRLDPLWSRDPSLPSPGQNVLFFFHDHLPKITHTNAFLINFLLLPTAYYEWPVKIPANVPSCNKKNQCLFVWSWTANQLPQYYHNCADVTIDGVKNGKLPSKSIQIVDFPGRRTGVTENGDGNKHKASTGPSRKEIDNNMRGIY